MTHDHRSGVQLRGTFADYRVILASRASPDDLAAAEHPALVLMDVDRWLDDPMVRHRLYDIAAALGVRGISCAFVVDARGELRSILQRALESRTLVALPVAPWISPSTTTRAARSPQPSVPPVAAEGSPTTPAAAVALTWIEIELIDASSRPVSGARYTVTLPDFADRTGVLGDDGRARVDGVEPGVCGVVFHDYAAEDWGAESREGGGYCYTVQQGDCLSSIAARLGFADWRTIYRAPQNESFRTKRPDPNVLYAGDEIVIPGREAEPVERGTGARHTFRLRTTATRLRVRVLVGFPFPVQHLYRLTVDGVEHEGSIAEGGIIDVPIPAEAAGGHMAVWPQLGYPLTPFEWTFRLGGLDPVSELSGIQARLNNLGFRCGAVDGVMGPKTSAALALFQGERQLARTGTLDDRTRDALRATHDVA